LLAGGGPAATYLFCFAKKGRPKKATAQTLPFGFPFVRGRKWETKTTRLRLRHFSFLIHFLPRTNGSVSSGTAKSNGKSKGNGNGNGKSRGNGSRKA